MCSGHALVRDWSAIALWLFMIRSVKTHEVLKLKKKRLWPKDTELFPPLEQCSNKQLSHYCSHRAADNQHMNKTFKRTWKNTQSVLKREILWPHVQHDDKTLRLRCCWLPWAGAATTHQKQLISSHLFLLLILWVCVPRVLFERYFTQHVL